MLSVDKLKEVPKDYTPRLHEIVFVLGGIDQQAIAIIERYASQYQILDEPEGSDEFDVSRVVNITCSIQAIPDLVRGFDQGNIAVYQVGIC